MLVFECCLDVIKHFVVADSWFVEEVGEVIPPPGVSQLLGSTGLKPAPIRVAIVADIGPLTIVHLFFAVATPP